MAKSKHTQPVDLNELMRQLEPKLRGRSQDELYELLACPAGEFPAKYQEFVDVPIIDVGLVQTHRVSLQRRIARSLDFNRLDEDRLQGLLTQNPDISMMLSDRDRQSLSNEAQGVIQQALNSEKVKLIGEISSRIDILEGIELEREYVESYEAINATQKEVTRDDITRLRLILAFFQEKIKSLPDEEEFEMDMSPPTTAPGGASARAAATANPGATTMAPPPPPPPPPSGGASARATATSKPRAAPPPPPGVAPAGSGAATMAPPPPPPPGGAPAGSRAATTTPVPSSTVSAASSGSRMPIASAKPDDFNQYEEDLIDRIRAIEESLPALSEKDREALGVKINEIQAIIGNIRRLAEQATGSKNDKEIRELKKNAAKLHRRAVSVTRQPDGIDVGKTHYHDFLDARKSSPDRNDQKAYRAYEIEKGKYEGKLAALRVQQKELDHKEAEFAKAKEIFEEMKRPKIPPMAGPTDAMLKQKEQELAEAGADLANRRLRLSIEKESAGSMLVSLTKMYGGYSDLSRATTLKMYRGGELGFETRVMTRAAATKVGLLNDALGGMSVSSRDENAYAANVKLASNEVIVSTKSYGDAQVVIVKEPNIVRDMSPKGQVLTEKEMNEKALQMAIMFAIDYKQGKPAIIRGGEPELRQRAHAYLLAFKYASQEGTMEMTMNRFLGKTPTALLTWASNKFAGKQLADIDLKDLQVLSDVGPQQCGSSMFDRLKRGVHSIEYAQKTRDMAFVERTLGPLSGCQFEEQKKEYLSLRDQGARKASSKDDITFVEDPKGPTKK